MRIKIAALLLLSLTALMADAARLYRFKIDGRVVVKDHIPAEYAHLGYQVLNSGGLLLDEVAPALTQEEKDALKREQAAKELRIKRIKAQRIADRDLLRLYAKPSDVNVAEVRKMEEIQSLVKLQERRIEGLEQRLAIEQEKAANIERRGRSVPKTLQSSIKRIKERMLSGREKIVDYKEDMKTAEKEFAKILKRVTILQRYPIGTLEEDIEAEPKAR